MEQTFTLRVFDHRFPFSYPSPPVTTPTSSYSAITLWVSIMLMYPYPRLQLVFWSMGR